jgi:exopolyphosphatase/guanosine-5'-triphosphate,3'-diphosphate pyrophosphatase
VNAVVDVLVAAGWPEGAVSREGLDWLQDKLLAAQTADRIRLAGMREDRKAIIGGGLSVLRALFDLLGIQILQQASGGLRHGLLQDMLGDGQQHADLRDHSVARLAAKFGADAEHGRRVGRVANQLFKNIAADLADTRVVRKLTWAAQLHEIGSHISHSDYHKHGAYILDNTDALGFALTELHRLSMLVLGHRGKLKKLEADFDDERFIQQLLVLRLAVALCHARRDPDLRGLKITRHVSNAREFTLIVPAAWASQYPQSAHLLNEESVAWQKTPWSLTVVAS